MADNPMSGRYLVSRADGTAQPVVDAPVREAVERALAICEDAAEMSCTCYSYYTCNGCERRIAERADDAADVLRDVLARVPVVAPPPCPTCKGSGDQTQYVLDGDQVAKEIHRDCPSCKGWGVERMIPESEIREFVEDCERGGGHPTGDVIREWLDEREART